MTDPSTTVYVVLREGDPHLSRFHLSRRCAGARDRRMPMSLNEAATAHIPCGNCVPDGTVKEVLDH